MSRTEQELTQLTENYEIQYADRKKAYVDVLVEFKYNRVEGLHVHTVQWTNSTGEPIDFAALPWTEQVWLINDLNKKIKWHCEAYDQPAFAFFELNEEP